MKIEKLEINGFKSFSEKTVFSFHHGVTAVAGPNGCGKSNLVDAFKWVLGEQSAKSLRGLKMEDVIFAGSSSQKPKGMAEVSLHFAENKSEKGSGNGAGSKNVKKLSVGRRLFRSGDSDYFINKKSFRLKDVREALIDTGLGMKAYSIFEQGRVDEILNSKPQDRRFIIEEIAGIIKYKARKTETLKKIDNSRMNLQRLKDIISEVERQYKSVGRHAQKAEKYKIYVTELKDVEIRVAAFDFKTLKEQLDSAIQRIGELNTREGELLKEKAQADRQLEEKKLAFVDQESVFLTCQENLRKEEKAATESEGTIKLITSQIEGLKERTVRLKKEKQELDSHRERLDMREEKSKKELAEKETQAQDFSSIIEEHTAIAARIDDEIKDDEDSIRDDRGKLISLAEKTSNLKNSTVHLAKTVEDLARKVEKVKKEQEETVKGVEELDSALEEAKKAALDLDKELTAQIERTENLKKTLNTRRQERKAQENLVSRKREDLASSKSRLESLQELEADIDTEQVDGSISVLCQVADIIETDPVYEKAVEAALGQQLNLSIVKNYTDIKKALEVVKSQGLKRRGFVCLECTCQISSSVAALPDTLQKAVDLVKVQEEFNDIAVRLLQDVFIVNDFDIAFDIWSGSNGSSYPCLVTLEGEVLRPQGLAYGGRERGILALKRQIRELKEGINKLEAEIQELKGTLGALENEISAMKNALSVEDKKIVTLEKEKQRAAMARENLQKDKTRIERRVHYLEAEAKDHKSSLSKNQELLEETDRALKSADREKDRLNETMKDLQALIDEKRLMIEGLKGDLTDKKVLYATVQENMRSLKNDIKGIEKGKVNAAEKLRHNEEQMKKTASDREIRESTLAQTQEFLTTVVQRVSDLTGEHEKLRKGLEQLRMEIEAIEGIIGKLNPELDKVRKELSQQELQKAELTMKGEHIKEAVLNTYAIHIDSWPVVPIEEGDREKAAELKQSIKSLGSVNLSTLDEYEELKQRFEFLTSQQDDLIKSIEGLESIINKINVTSRKLLEDAFNSLNEKFKEVFIRLFGSGRAELLLLEGDILEAGIEIIAQPPGKKPQSLVSLSGGEKALTAIALLFAGFMIKPTPMCLLDEVDAPLDEPNTDRFTALIRELSTDIQFIIVTHNKRVMESADYIYGITMQEAGVSRTVSLKLVEENENA